MSKILNIEKILEMMPHRYPFLLIDRLLKVEKETATCELSAAENFLKMM